MRKFWKRRSAASLPLAVWGTVAIFSAAPSGLAFGQSASQGAAIKSTGTGSVVPDESEALNRLITGLVLANIPHDYRRDRGWGNQSERWDGIRWEMNGWQIKTKRRKKSVNHGTWRRYRISLADPANGFDVRVSGFHPAGGQAMGFRLEVAARLDVHARQAEWVKGVQLYSVSAEARASVRLTVDMEMAIQLDPANVPPDVVFLPRANAARLDLDDFQIDRVSKLGGEFAQQMTRLARTELDAAVAEKQRELVGKINREIGKNSDDLRLSLAMAIRSRWARQAIPFLPPAVSQAIEALDRP